MAEDVVTGGPGSALADLAALAKLRVSALSTLSAATGFVAFAREPRAPIVPALAGTFLLAAGAAALNEVLERDRDARMTRTRDRPIPAGRVGAATAAGLGALAAAGGATTLWLTAGPLPALLGIAALVWYDAVYTPLKRATAFAVLPGAIVGALPPAMGWTAAGGAVGDARLHALCAVLLLWQVPHFWLLALRHADDYARGGFPTPARRFSAAQISRITLAWTLSMAGAALLLPAFGVTRSPWSEWAIVGAAIWALPAPIALARTPGRAERIGAAFASVNGFVLALMAIVLADAMG